MGLFWLERDLRLVRERVQVGGILINYFDVVVVGVGWANLFKSFDNIKSFLILSAVVERVL